MAMRTSDKKSTSSMVLSLHQSIHNLQVKVHNSPLALRVVGYLLPSIQAFRWKLSKHAVTVLKQTSGVPKIPEPTSPIITVIGIINCLSKVQTLGWEQDIIVHCDTDTHRLITTKESNPINNAILYLTHLFRQMKVNIKLDSHITFNVANEIQQTRGTSLPPQKFPPHL
jgi:hypothetical protein